MPFLISVLNNGVNSSAPGHVRISEHLSERAVQVLVENGLQTRFPKECRAWAESDARLRQDEAFVQENRNRMEDAVREAIMGEFCRYFPYVTHIFLILC